MPSKPDAPPPGAPPPGAAPRRRRRVAAFETALHRVVATLGVIGVGVGLGALLASQDVAGWIIGLVVSLESVVLTGLLWSRET